MADKNYMERLAECRVKFQTDHSVETAMIKSAFTQRMPRSSRITATVDTSGHRKHIWIAIVCKDAETDDFINSLNASISSMSSSKVALIELKGVVCGHQLMLDLNSDAVLV